MGLCVVYGLLEVTQVLIWSLDKEYTLYDDYVFMEMRKMIGHIM